MQLARIKGDPEKKRCWYSISQLQCSCSRHPLFHSTPLILLLAPPAARLKAEWKGFPRGSRAKTLEQDKIGRGWIPSCYFCSSLSSLPMPIILAQYSQQGTKSFANGQHWQCLLPTGQGQKSTFLELRRLRKVEGCGF